MQAEASVHVEADAVSSDVDCGFDFAVQQAETVRVLGGGTDADVVDAGAGEVNRHAVVAIYPPNAAVVDGAVGHSERGGAAETDAVQGTAVHARALERQLRLAEDHAARSTLTLRCTLAEEDGASLYRPACKAPGAHKGTVDGLRDALVATEQHRAHIPMIRLGTYMLQSDIFYY